MKPLFLFLLGLLVGATGHAAVRLSEAHYGVAVPYAGVILTFPDFRLRLKVHRERARTDGRPFWENDVFEAYAPAARLSASYLTAPVGGDIDFSSEHRVNARIFDVQGEKFVAELFFTTEGGRRRAIPNGQIIVWNMAAAQAHNHTIARIWEAPLPNHALATIGFRDGIVIPTFHDDERLDEAPVVDPRLESGFPLAPPVVLKRIPLILANEISTAQLPPAADYGGTVRYDHGPLAYPGFILALVERDRSTPVESLTGTTRLLFSAYDRTTGEVRSKFIANAYQGENGFGFQIYQDGFIAELFRSTAGSPPDDPRPAAQLPALAEGEMIVWDPAQASAQNSRLAAAWSPPGPHRTVPLHALANGINTDRAIVIADPGFNVTEPTSAFELDRVPEVLARTPAPYPAELRHSGYILRGAGFLELSPDGTVHNLALLQEGDLALAPFEEAVSHWRFTPPRIKGVAQTVSLPFWFELTEENSGTVLLNWE